MRRRPNATSVSAQLAIALLAASACNALLGNGDREAVDVPVSAEGGQPGTDAAADVGVADGGSKRIFMTSRGFTGNLVAAAKGLGTYDGGDGLLAADSLCGLEAPDSGTKWTAWVSVEGIGAFSRFRDRGPRVGVNGQPVLPALGKEPTSAIPDVNGKLHPEVDGNGRDGSFVWTGTFSDGSPGTFNGTRADCKGWVLSTGSDFRGTAGNPGALEGGHWSAVFYGQFCELSGHLYCLED